MGPIALYRRLAAVSIRSQLQYRLSYAMQTLGAMLVAVGEFLGIWALFSRFGGLAGWDLAHICVFYGLANASFAIADAMTEGFDHLGEMIRLGEFDRILLRPRSSVLMLLGYELTLRRAGRLLQAVIILGYGLVGSAGIPLAPALALVAWTIACSVALFVGIRVLQGCVTFRTIESIEFMNVFTYGGVTTASYPFPIFVRWFRRLFIFVIPIAAVSYYPGLALMQFADPLGAPIWIGWVSPAAGPLFLGVALVAWRHALGAYASTGS